MKNLFNNNISELFLKLLPVQIFIVIASSLSSLVNGYLISNNLVIPDSMNAMGLVTPIVTLLTALAYIVSGGAGILCGQYMGRGDHDKINDVFSISIMMLIISGIVLSGIIYLFAPALATFLKAEANIYVRTLDYIKGISIGVIPSLVLPTLMTFMQMLNKSNLSLLSVILMAILNAVLVIISINLNMDIFGVGAATSLSKIIVMVLLLAYLLLKKDMLKFTLKSFDSKLAFEMLKLGSPASLAGILYSIRNVFINSYAFDIAGNDGVNAQSVLASYGGFYDSINIGIGQALTMLASVFIGERDLKSLKKLIKITTVTGLFLAFLKVVIAYVFGKQVAVLFGATNIPLTYDLAVLYGWSSPPNIFTIVIISVLSTLGEVGVCNFFYLFNCIITPFMCCSVLSKFIGIKAVWSCYYIAELVTIAMFIIRATIKNKHLPKNVDDMFNFGQDFDEVNKYSISIKDVQEVVLVSKNIEKLCKSNGIDDRRSMLAGLCMEELAGNIVEEGFPMDKKENTVDVFVCVENDEVLMRIRDNCINLDPRDKIEIDDPEDPINNIGIKMVSKIAKEMHYQTTFGMNVLSIKL